MRFIYKGVFYEETIVFFKFFDYIFVSRGMDPVYSVLNEKKEISEEESRKKFLETLETPLIQHALHDTPEKKEILSLKLS